MLGWYRRIGILATRKTGERVVSGRFRAGIAGIAGAVLAFGIAELVHGLLYESVPSVFVSLAQRVVELTPGELVTRGIEILGTADIPTLIATMIVGALIVAALLANIALRSPIAALIGVVALAVIPGGGPPARTVGRPFMDPP